jgi:hypothetical protein
LQGLNRYIATVETAKHRIFGFLNESIIPDNKLVVIGSADAFHLGVLSARVHLVWTAARGALLEDRPVYVKSECFDPFPFPTADEFQKQRIQEIAEELDAHRKRRQEAHRDLTLTDMYNVLEPLRAGAAPGDLDPDDRRIFDEGLVLILKELHDKLDAAVAAAYGWPSDLPDEMILARLIALNKARAAEEARGLVRWLRPEYQIPRFGSPSEKAEQIEAHLVTAEAKAQKPSFPTDDVAQTAAVMAALAEATDRLDAAAIATGFRQGKRIEPKVRAVLVALARLGFIATPDGGNSFLLRRAS